MNTENLKQVILTESEDMGPLIARIQQLLMKKAIVDGVAQDEKNKTPLGGVLFYFSKDSIGNYFMIYNQNPKYWNLEPMIEDIDRWEDYFHSLR